MSNVFPQGIDAYLEAVRLRRKKYRAAEAACLYCLLVFMFALAVFSVDSFAPLPPGVKYACWLLAVAAAALLGGHTLRGNASDTRKNLVLLLQRQYPFLSDDLMNAWELERDAGFATSRGFSESLAREHVAATLGKVREQLPPAKVTAFSALRKYQPLAFCELVFFLALLVSPRFSLRGEAARFLYPSGTPQMRGSADTIKVRPEPELGNFRLTYHFPQYTALPPREGTLIGEIPCPAGTRIAFSAESNIPLKSAELETSWNAGVPAGVTGERRVNGEFLVEKEGECHFNLRDTGGNVNNNPIIYPIGLVKDQPPEITLLSPAADLVAAQDSVVPLVYRASDDYGVAAVRLATKLNGAVTFAGVENPSPPYRDKINEYELDLSRTKAAPGDILEYYLEASDNDPFGGPKKAFTPAFRIEIFSYEKEHEAIEEDLAGARKDLLDVLVAQTSAKQHLDGMTAAGHTPTEDERRQLREMQKAVSGDTRKLADRLKDILPRMQNDPSTNFKVFTEYQQMLAGLEDLQAGQMQDIADAVEKKDYAAAAPLQEEVISALEKMSLVSEDVLQYQKMKDVLAANEKLAGLSRDMVSSLSGAMDPGKMNQLKKAMEETNRLMQEIQKLLKKMPQELPEEFVNQEGVKNLDLGKMNASVDSLNDALSRGDYSAALRQAQDMLKQAQSMLDTLQKASESSGFSSAQSGMAEQASKLSAELQDIVSEQGGIISETSRLENIRQGLVMAEEKAAFAKLAELQERLIKKYGVIRDRIAAAGYPADLREQYAAGSAANLPGMVQVLSELRAARIERSRDLLTGIVGWLGGLERTMSSFEVGISTKNRPAYRELEQGTADIRAGEEKILDILKNGPEVSFGSGERAGLNGLSGKQGGLAGRTRDLDKRLQELSRNTSVMSPEISARLRKAAGAMDFASGQLGRFDSKGALESEQRALDDLTEGGRMMGGGARMLGQMKTKAGEGPGGFIQMKGGRSPAPYGARQGYVKLPEKDRYVPSREFREELLKSMKEKYPKIYEDMIRRYYERLMK